MGSSGFIYSLVIWAFGEIRSTTGATSQGGCFTDQQCPLPRTCRWPHDLFCHHATVKYKFSFCQFFLHFR
ncbi:hypothetical protein PVAP13_7KG313503 [Panicum virgatum]|uniref:Secreted protein n=1 Tax=Panicum virgatum TaxID=38727 RepID=A0A8T0QJ48_PANVG|nr:hypothetical protein PVAP13_7KG313503 [Panicum virgatum]